MTILTDVTEKIIDFKPLWDIFVSIHLTFFSCCSLSSDLAHFFHTSLNEYVCSSEQ
jgi:hypothetical protein